MDSKALFKTHERLQTDSAAYWRSEHQIRYEFCKPFARGKRVLDAGSGTGYGADSLAQVASRVVGVDKDESSIYQARKRYSRENLQFAVMDCIELGLTGNIFDFICSLEVIEHLKDQEGYLLEIKRVLKDKGIFILSSPNPEKVPLARLHPHHVKVLNVAELNSLLRKVFREVEIYGQQSSASAMRLYRFPVIQGIFRVMAFLGVKILVPLFLKKIQRGIEKLTTKSSLDEVNNEEFTISKDTAHEADGLIAVCLK